MLMNSCPRSYLTTRIIEKAKDLGASLSGVASVAALQKSPSHQIGGRVDWRAEARAVLVLAMAHEVSEPELDWWDDRGGGTPGNRRLIITAKKLRQWLGEELRITAQPLPYHVEEGGIFLKDAAVLAGLGVVGKNNLLVTREFGPRVRLRALLLDVDLPPTAPLDFAPCAACDGTCWQACPQKAFTNGYYHRALCDIQMRQNEANKVSCAKPAGASPGLCVQYCRACELACPVARSDLDSKFPNS
jgi:epoxyqueuosine reductase